MELLSIQSSVAFGHVGNSAAIFPLQRLGIEAWAVNTVHFSNHTGYGEWRGPLLSAEDLRAVIQGVEERGVLARVAAVLSGYQGAEDVGAVVLETVARVKQLNPAAVYCCDPVMGDAEHLGGAVRRDRAFAHQLAQVPPRLADPGPGAALHPGPELPHHPGQQR